jgi:hypothetical protein
MGNIQRRLRTEPCKNARSAACHTVGHAFKRSIVEVSNRQYRNEGKVKTIDVAELYFKVKDFLEDFDPTTGPIYIDRPQGPVTKQLQNYKGLKALFNLTTNQLWK